jgi:hypothetical protein
MALGDRRERVFFALAGRDLIEAVLGAGRAAFFRFSTCPAYMQA